MAKPRNLHLGPRELFLMLESLALSMEVLRGSFVYDELPPDRLRALNEAHSLWLEIEEVWDSMPARERRAGAREPFDVRNIHRRNQRV